MSTLTDKGDPMTDTDTRPVTNAEIAAVTIAGLPELVRRMLANGSEPAPKDEAPADAQA